jgi:hypothetical protein
MSSAILRRGNTLYRGGRISSYYCCCTGRRSFTRSVASPQQRSPPPSSSGNNNNHDASYKQGMDKLKQTNPILHKMTPPRGGTELPDAKFMVVAGVVLSAGFYAWFIHDDSPINRTK